MGIRSFLRKAEERSLRRNVLEVQDGLKRRLAPTVAFGPSVFDRDWDVLVVLDACRADTFETVGKPVVEASESMTLSEYEAVVSNAPHSKAWLERTFIEDYRLDCSQTAYVTANVFSGEVFDPDRHPFAALEEVWRDRWNDDHGTVLAADVVDAAMPYVDAEERPDDVSRVVVHLMQPHFPSVPDPVVDDSVAADGEMAVDKWGAGNDIDFAWQLLQEREVTADRVIESYNRNLEYVLDAVDPLVARADGRVVLTADHGQAFGEWGYFGHPRGAQTREVLEVPWAVVKDRTTEAGPAAGATDDIEEKLEALGYR